MRCFKFIAVLILLSGIQMSAQTNDILVNLSTPSVNGTVVTMPNDRLLSGLIDLQREINESTSGIPGYRVLLFKGNDVNTARSQAENVKQMFLEKYPNEIVYVDYQQPVWKILVGDCRTYGEALKKRNQLEIDLPQIKDYIYIIPAEVNY